MSKEAGKKRKRLVSIFARTAVDVLECEEVINECIKNLDRSGFEIVLCVERAKMRVVNGVHTTHILVVGDSDGGWKQSGMKSLCDCLETSGYLVQAINAAHSFIPPSSEI